MISRMLFGLMFVAAIAKGQTTCSFTITPDHAAFPATGKQAVGFKVVSSDFPCSNAASIVYNVTWLHPAAFGSVNNNVVTFGVFADDNTGVARSGTFTVDGLTVKVTQDGGAPPNGVTAPTFSAPGIVNGASFQNTALAPGEIISIFGDNMGPAAPVSAQLDVDGKFLLTSVGGTTVTFNFFEAPILFTSTKQLSVIVPFEVSDDSVVDIQVNYQGNVSTTVSMPTTLASPAIFSVDSSGKGQGVILNQDLSLNSATNPAHPGDTIVIYATGEGLNNPFPLDGELAPAAEPFPRPLLPVQVFIDGKLSTVSYAGGAPGFVAGLLQVNATVPDDVTTGTSVPVTLNAGTTTNSPNTITAVIQPK